PPGSVEETTLAEGEKKDVVLRLVPAAAITARLVCLDRGPLPEKAAVRVFPVAASGEDEDPASRKDAVLDRGDLILTGRDKDGLFVGPLPAGPHTMALRPDGFDRWTFPPGPEDPERATPLIL